MLCTQSACWAGHGEPYIRIRFRGQHLGRIPHSYWDRKAAIAAKDLVQANYPHVLRRKIRFREE